MSKNKKKLNMNGITMTYEEIAKILNLSVTTLYDGLKELEKDGFITITKKGDVIINE